VINKFEYLSEVSKGNLAGKEMDIDLATFEPLGLQLAKDKNGIFYCGGNCGASEEDVCYRLPAIDVNSFEILNNTYLKDKNHIYNYGCM